MPDETGARDPDESLAFPHEEDAGLTRLIAVETDVGPYLYALEARQDMGGHHESLLLRFYRYKSDLIDDLKVLRGRYLDDLRWETLGAVSWDPETDSVTVYGAEEQFDALDRHTDRIARVDGPDDERRRLRR